MTRLSSLFIATTLVILPLSAFAQQTTAPVEKTVPSSVTSTTTAHAIKSDVKSPVHEAKAKEHGKNIVKIHQTREKMPSKTTKPAQS